MKKNEIIVITFMIIGAFGIDSCSTTTPTIKCTDIDGNVYQTVTIGTQVWMAENLKVTKYRNGDPIPNVTDSTTWYGLSSGAYCNYNNNVSNASTYGILYNGNAVIDSRNIAPVGWHVATPTEWSTLANYLGGLTIAGGKMKEAGTSHWNSPNTGADNISGFTGLPGGWRNGFDGSFQYLGSRGHWWVTNEPGSTGTYIGYLVYNDGINYTNSVGGSFGLSVRCVKD